MLTLSIHLPFFHDNKPQFPWAYNHRAQITPSAHELPFEIYANTSVLAKALNQQETANRVAVPAVMISKRVYFLCSIFTYIYTWRTQRPIKVIKISNDHMSLFSTFCIAIVLDKPSSLTYHHVLFIQSLPVNTVGAQLRRQMMRQLHFENVVGEKALQSRKG